MHYLNECKSHNSIALKLSFASLFDFIFFECRDFQKYRYLVERENETHQDGRISSRFSVLGSTGNVYQTTISQVPQCTCPDFVREHDVCKHLIFVFCRVLGRSEDDPLVWQRALLQSEIRDIVAAGVQSRALANSSVRAAFRDATAPATKKAKVEAEAAAPPTGAVPRRKVEADDECPICFESLASAASADLAWCEGEGGCGKALHSDCAGKWTKAKRNDPTCPFCRAAWVASGLVTSPAAANEASGSEGYVNLGRLQGMQTTRDSPSYAGYSSYRYGSHYRRGYRSHYWR